MKFHFMGTRFHLSGQAKPDRSKGLLRKPLARRAAAAGLCPAPENRRDIAFASILPYSSR